MGETATATLWVRHGESTWNRRGLMQGQIGSPPLTSLGIDQARGAAARLLRYDAARIISSDLARAAQTARLISDRLALPVQFDRLLRERHWGVFQGRPVTEGHRTESRLRADQPVPQGESRNDVADRLRRLVPALTGPGPVVVVTHGDVIREALRVWTPGGRGEPPTGNGCIVEIVVDDPGLVSPG